MTRRSKPPRYFTVNIHDHTGRIIRKIETPSKYSAKKMAERQENTFTRNEYTSISRDD